MVRTGDENDSQRCDSAAVAVCFADIGATAQETIRFATEGAYPPFNERAADGTLIGFEIDLGMAMCARSSANASSLRRIGTA